MPAPKTRYNTIEKRGDGFRGVTGSAPARESWSMSEQSMTTTEDYYTLLGLSPDATDQDIRAAFKQMARRYHPDVYAGADADERMRKLIAAYQTLRDPEKRRAYDRERQPAAVASEQQLAPKDTSPSATREFIFPDLVSAMSSGLTFRLQGHRYTLSSAAVAVLLQEGVLHGHDRHAGHGATYWCHRCNHEWTARPGEVPTACPSCHARDWDEYLLLRCAHCQAVFESAEIHEYHVREVKGQFQTTDHTCTPYELYPLCPHCRAGGWCPAEEQRLMELRKKHRLARWIARLKIAFVLATLATVISATAYFIVTGTHP